MTMITVMTKAAGKKLRTKKIEHTLENMQALVEGYIEKIELPQNIDMWINDESKINESEPNLLLLRDFETVGDISGNVFFAGHDEEGETISLKAYQQRWIKENVIPFWTKIYRFNPNHVLYELTFDHEEY